MLVLWRGGLDRVRLVSGPPSSIRLLDSAVGLTRR